MNLCAMSKENRKFKQWDNYLPGGVTEIKMMTLSNVSKGAAQHMLSVFAGGSAEWSIDTGGEFDYYKNNINKRELCWRRD